MIANSIVDLIGNTPLLSLPGLAPEGAAALYGKAEYLNPMGSVKDRPALSMILAAERSGRLRPGMTIVEPTSGNTGVGLAMVGAVKGYRVMLIVQRKDIAKGILRIANALGAETIETTSMAEAVRFAEGLAREAPEQYFVPQQFKNGANPRIHLQTTAEEILREVGPRLKAFVASYGSGGTFTGIGQALRAHDPSICLVLVEPDTVRHFSGGPVTCSEIHGIGPSFIPDILDQSLIDETIRVSEEQACETAVFLARRLGILCGPSAGAMAHAAARVAARFGSSDAVVTILPDRGERYFGNDFFPD